MNAAELHADAIVIDTTCPLARIHKYLDWYREGGATAIAPTITGASGNAVMPWLSWLTAHTPDIVPAWMRSKRLTLLLSSLMPMPAPCRITAAMSRMN